VTQSSVQGETKLHSREEVIAEVSELATCVDPIAGRSPFEQAAEGADRGQDSPMHTLEQARRTVTAFMDPDLPGQSSSGVPVPPAARRQPSTQLPDSPMTAGQAGVASAAAFAPVRE
jgi:hypothetical protein